MQLIFALSLTHRADKTILSAVSTDPRTPERPLLLLEMNEVPWRLIDYAPWDGCGIAPDPARAPVPLASVKSRLLDLAGL